MELGIWNAVALDQRTLVADVFKGVRLKEKSELIGFQLGVRTPTFA